MNYPGSGPGSPQVDPRQALTAKTQHRLQSLQSLYLVLGQKVEPIRIDLSPAKLSSRVDRDMFRSLLE